MSFNLYNSLKYINLNKSRSHDYSNISLYIFNSHYYSNLYIWRNYSSIFNIYFMNLNKINLNRLYNSYYSIHMLNNFNHIFDMTFNFWNILYNNKLYKCQEFMYNNIFHHILDNHYNLNLNIHCNFKNTSNNYLFCSNNNLINNLCNKYCNLSKLNNFYRT